MKWARHRYWIDSVFYPMMILSGTEEEIERAWRWWPNNVSSGSAWSQVLADHGNIYWVCPSDDDYVLVKLKWL